MSIRYEFEPTAVLPEYSEVSIAFTVDRKFVVEAVDEEPDGWRLKEVAVDPPYIKDYDIPEPPIRWLRRDTSNWRVVSAYCGGQRVGGAVVAWKTPNLHFLEGRDDVAALWDLRVSPEWRGRGVGSALFKRAVEYAKSRKCSLLKIETQNINVAACRFYAKMGCRLTEIDPNAYPEFPEETQLVWTLDL